MILEKNISNLENVKTSTIVAFLRSEGWKLMEKTETSFLIKPPKEFNTNEHARLRIPLPEYEKAEDYPMVINLVLNTISVLYNRKKEDLVKFFSKTIEELKEEMETTNKLLEFAD